MECFKLKIKKLKSSY